MPTLKDAQRISSPMRELRACRNCGTMIEAPATVCSQACYSEAYGESKRELYEDERHESGVEDDETESEGD